MLGWNTPVYGVIETGGRLAAASFALRAGRSTALIAAHFVMAVEAAVRAAAMAFSCTVVGRTSALCRMFITAARLALAAANASRAAAALPASTCMVSSVDADQ